jgi:hypothetical protein
MDPKVKDEASSCSVLEKCECEQSCQTTPVQPDDEATVDIVQLVESTVIEKSKDVLISVVEEVVKKSQNKYLLFSCCSSAASAAAAPAPAPARARAEAVTKAEPEAVPKAETKDVSKAEPEDVPKAEPKAEQAEVREPSPLSLQYYSSWAIAKAKAVTQYLQPEKK